MSGADVHVLADYRSPAGGGGESLGERRDSAPPLAMPPGGGDSTGMEARIAALEAHMEHVRADVSTLKADTGEIKTAVTSLSEKVTHLPSKEFVGTTMRNWLAAAVGLLTLLNLAALILTRHT